MKGCGAVIEIRQATLEDEPELRRIDLATWTPLTSPADPPENPDEWRFFDGERRTPEGAAGRRPGRPDRRLGQARRRHTAPVE